ncbi:MAG: hypothetical protein ACXWZS_03325 [Gemmatirosa sp.]
MLRDLPTHRPWLDPIAMRWRQFRREDTHCERFESVQDLLAPPPATSATAPISSQAGCAPSSGHTPHDS